ncbi:MAG: DUF4389 domain-containing protein [Acidimicrobiales bacterium]
MSYCTNCGTEEREGQQFCGVCGVRRPGPLGAAPMPPLSSVDVSASAEVRVGISLLPSRQSRWSVFVRALLVVPLYLVIIAVGFAAFFVTIVAWFCALFTGRVSDGQQRFLTNTLRLYGNTQAYWYLLVPRWPGVTFSAKPNDQVSIDIDHVRLRRWSVFFRIVLMVPALLVGDALNLGTFPLVFVAWVWGVLVGREPRSIHQALALVLRYQLRLQAYWTLLTPTQPFRGFLGDGLETGSRTSGVNVVASSPDLGDPYSSIAKPAASVGLSVGTPSSNTLPTRWFVSKAAKVLMVLTLAAGAVLYFVAPSFENPFFVRMQDMISRGVVTTSHTVTLSAMRRFVTSTASCGGAYLLECQQRAATFASPRVAEQSSLLLSNNFLVPTTALASVKLYELSLDSLANELFTVQTSNSLTLQTRVVRVAIPATLIQVNRDFRAAEARLGG